ncbi:hypothetical protein B0H19DRAFT_216713 [Mycena capillaripes]|nr:hypothetical protein B0H19DRAFT_216713 [Mycena capillaripes]
MTPDEIKTLRAIGHDVVRGFVAITNETVWLTVYAVLVLKASYVLLGKDKRRQRSSLLTFLAILTMFLIAVVLWALDLANFIMEAKLTLIVDPDLPLSTRLANARSFMFPLIAAIDALYAYMSLLGDAIILWRVWNLKGYYRPWVFVFPLALLLGSLISTLMLTYCVAEVGSDIVIGVFEKPAFCRNVQLVTYSTAFATTTVATILIGMTVWNYRKSIGPMLRDSFLESGSKPRRSQAETILLLLLESGLLYFLFFAIQLIAAIPRVHSWISARTDLSFALLMYSYCSSVIVGIYPTAVIALAHSRGVLDQAAAAASVTASTLRTPTSRQSGVWPTFQIGTKPDEDDIELRSELHSSSPDLHRGSNKPRVSWEA